MKKSKIIVPALGMLLLSTAASITGTVAWFTANNKVNVGGMNIKAEAENGIVIAAEEATHTAASWSTEATALHTGAGLSFIPASTKIADNDWWHGISKKADNGQYEVTYEKYTVTDAALNTAASVGQGKTDIQVPADKNIYLLNHFYIQASAPTALTQQDLVVKSLTVTDSGNKALNKSIRVLFKLGSTTKIYCPLADGDFTATTYAGAASKAAADDRLLDEGTIPAYNAAGTGALDLSVYCYFEGEDANCKSSNIENELTGVSVSFELENIQDA